MWYCALFSEMPYPLKLDGKTVSIPRKDFDLTYSLTEEHGNDGVNIQGKVIQSFSRASSTKT